MPRLVAEAVPCRPWAGKEPVCGGRAPSSAGTASAHATQAGIKAPTPGYLQVLTFRGECRSRHFVNDAVEIQKGEPGKGFEFSSSVLPPGHCLYPTDFLALLVGKKGLEVSERGLKFLGDASALQERTRML